MAPTRLRIGFLADPLEDLLPHHDTTYALMVEAQKREHEVWTLEQEDLVFRSGRTLARMSRVELMPDAKPHFVRHERSEQPLCGLDVLFLRKDPPVDEAFLHATQLVELCGEPSPLFVNSPRALRDCNEKLVALRFPELIPPTWVSRDVKTLRTFLDEVSPEAVLKPLDGFGGLGVVHLKKGDRNVASLLELHTGGGSRQALMQAYLPESREGDKRILVLDGEPLGAVLRVPPADDVRANLAVGGTAAKATLTAEDRRICATLSPFLRSQGLYFVGLDVIGGKLTELNVTSPTGLKEIDALDGRSLESDVLGWVEKRCRMRAPPGPRSTGQS